MGDEVWRDVLGFEGAYQVSSLGRVRSLPRTVPVRYRDGRLSERREIGRILRPRSKDRGYLTVHLMRDGERHERTIHSIVCEAFHGPAPEGHEVAHGNNRPGDNAESNLRWATESSNALDRRENGTAPIGEENPNAKIGPDQVRAIRARAGERQASLATEFGITQAQVSKIILRQSWGHLP